MLEVYFNEDLKDEKKELIILVANYSKLTDAKQIEINLQNIIDDLVFGIIKLRKKKGLSQIELSKRSGIPQSTISRLESFRTIPTLQVIIKLYLGLGQSIDFKEGNIVVHED